MHRSRLANVIIDCNDLRVATRFWTEALGTEVASEDPPYVFLQGGAGGLRVGLQLVPERKTARARFTSTSRRTIWKQRWHGWKRWVRAGSALLTTGGSWRTRTATSFASWVAARKT